MLRRSIAAASALALLVAGAPALGAQQPGEGKPQPQTSGNRQADREASRTAPQREARTPERPRPARSAINPFRDQIEHTIARV